MAKQKSYITAAHSTKYLHSNVYQIHQKKTPKRNDLLKKLGWRDKSPAEIRKLAVSATATLLLYHLQRVMRMNALHAEGGHVWWVTTGKELDGKIRG